MLRQTVTGVEKCTLRTGGGNRLRLYPVLRPFASTRDRTAPRTYKGIGIYGIAALIRVKPPVLDLPRRQVSITRDRE